MTDWSLIQSYWRHFYKYQCTLPNLFSIILRENQIEEEEINLNHDEEMGEEKAKGGE